MRRNIGIYGMTCAGKSTLGMELAAETGSYISFGDIRRDEVALQSPLGIEIERMLGLGNAIPAVLGFELLRGKFAEGFNFLSGFPISAEELAVLAENEAPLDGWIMLAADESVIKRRYRVRAECPECHLPGEVGGMCPVHALSMCVRPDASESEIASRKRLFEERILPFLRTAAMSAIPNIVIDTTALTRSDVLAAANAWILKQFAETLERVACSSA